MKINGRLLALGCLLLWSLAPPIAKAGVGQVGYLTFAFLVAVLASLFALPLFIKERGWDKVGKHWKQLAVLAFFAYFLFAILYFFGMENVSAIQGSALIGSEVMFALILGVMLGREKAGRREVLFTLLLMLGIAIAVMNGSFEFTSGFGSLLILASMLSLPIGFYIASDAIRACGVGTIILFGYLFQVIGTLLLFLLTGAEIVLALNSSAWLPIIAYAALSGVGASVFWYAALKRISLYVTTAIVVPAPAVAFVFSALLLGEQVTIYHIVGMVLIVLSVWKITASKDGKM